MHLAPNIYVARIDSRAVVLDLNRDRYIGLNAELSDALRELSSSPRKELQITAEDGAIAKLLHQGLLTDHGQRQSRNPLKLAKPSGVGAPEPTASLWALLSDERSSGGPISFADMMSALISLSEVAISLRLRSFRSTIGWIENSKIGKLHRLINWRAQTPAKAQNLERVQALVDAFDEVRPYFPIKPICRLDALSLRRHLRRNGQDAQLVFGVRLDPFAAHCWVQIGDVAISESWTHVRQYTPILVA